MGISFDAPILREGSHASIEIPQHVVDELGTHQRAPLVVTINSHTYRSTAVGVAGACRVVFPLRERARAGVSEGIVTVHLELDAGRRDVDVPPELASALDRNGLSEEFEAWSYSHRREWSRSVADAVRDETKARRILAVIAALQKKDM